MSEWERLTCNKNENFDQLAGRIEKLASVVNKISGGIVFGDAAINQKLASALAGYSIYSITPQRSNETKGIEAKLGKVQG